MIQFANTAVSHHGCWSVLLLLLLLLTLLLLFTITHPSISSRLMLCILFHRWPEVVHTRAHGIIPPRSIVCADIFIIASLVGQTTRHSTYIRTVQYNTVHYTTVHYTTAVYC